MKYLSGCSLHFPQKKQYDNIFGAFRINIYNIYILQSLVLKDN